MITINIVDPATRSAYPSTIHAGRLCVAVPAGSDSISDSALPVLTLSEGTKDGV